ncbi:hypothetical protein Bhyg_04089 [Pseudolycoriella hygida]|uniref:Uncharacterized protein n=1 Tax=Pseudolycoriella hygida TaxID=35572 RepID=A0A9Q0NEJ6_9DIPT|nr:hypothetical protein Bhyg_04089 [Pseudolycoriella hygida]
MAPPRNAVDWSWLGQQTIVIRNAEYWSWLEQETIAIRNAENGVGKATIKTSNEIESNREIGKSSDISSDNVQLDMRAAAKIFQLIRGAVPAD